MAAPSYATDLNDIYTDGGSWTVLSGRATDPDTDDYIQGASCWSHDPFSSGIEGGVVNSTETVATDDAVFVWTKADISPALATHAAGGVQVLIGASSTAMDCFYVRGSDDLIYGGWVCIPVDPTFTPSTVIGGGGAGTSYFGVRWNIPGSGPGKGYPFKIDAIRHGRQLEITAGDSGTPATWDATAVYDAGNTRMWGLCQPTDTGAKVQGLVYWGTGTTAVYSRDSNKNIVLLDTEWTVTDFTQILFAHASNDVVWDNVGVKALGTNNRGIIDVTADGDITWTNSVFEGIDVTNLLASSTFDGSKWLSTNEVDAGGASMLGCKILTPTVAADSYGLLWNVATDPNGYLDGMEFSKGTNSHHAIEFGLLAPTTMTLTGIDFTGFSGTSTAAALNFLRTTGATTVNLVGCTGTVTAQVTGTHTVTFVVDPVALSIHAVDQEDGTDIVGARALVWCDGTGPFPAEDSVTITSSSTTASVAHTAHGMATGDTVIISGATEAPYNGKFTISNVTTDAYDYTMGSTTTSPATGTITSTLVLIDGVTNSSGIITESRTYGTDQPIAGWIRKSTA